MSPGNPCPCCKEIGLIEIVQEILNLEYLSFFKRKVFNNGCFISVLDLLFVDKPIFLDIFDMETEI